VQFKALGFVIIDEQHRFGVLQRLRLMGKGGAEDRQPDVLVMTATPIPRTLALTYYGDLDSSVINELPAGRLPIITRKVEEANAGRAYEFVRKQVSGGAQAFIVYPVIDDPGGEDSGGDSEGLKKTHSKRINPRLPFATELKSAMKMYEHLSKDVFPEFRVGLLHGRLPSEEKERTMQAFQNGEIQILVGTTVIEVGVDVPNATVMVVEQSERFGLAQLHQLRGRVGRGRRQSYCMLMHSERISDVASQRLSAMVESTDGFALSELDLKLRGPGEFLGTKQSASISRGQSGSRQGHPGACPASGDWINRPRRGKGKETRTAIHPGELGQALWVGGSWLKQLIRVVRHSFRRIGGPVNSAHRRKGKSAEPAFHFELHWPHPWAWYQCAGPQLLVLAACR
jgi:ATP-dependent DNA helicase RecG